MLILDAFVEYGKSGEKITIGIEESNMFFCEIKYSNGDISGKTAKSMGEIHKFITERGL